MENNNMQNNENRNGNNNGKSPNRNFVFMLMVSVCLALLFFYAYSRYQTSQQIEISYSDFLNMIEEGTAKEVKIYSSTIEIIPKDEKELAKEKAAKEKDTTEKTDAEKSDTNNSDTDTTSQTTSIRRTGKKSYYCTRISDIYLVDRLEKAKENGELDYKAVDESSSAIIGNILSWVIMIGAFYLIIWLFMRSMSKNGGGIMGVGRSNAKMYMEKKAV